MLSNTGGSTYPHYMLPRWVAHPDDDVTAFFSRGQLPAALAVLPGVVELRGSTPNTSLNRGLDLHVKLRREIARRAPDVAYFPGNAIPFGPRLGVPTVVAMRSTLVFNYPGQLTPVWRTYLRTTTVHSVRTADRVIVPSSAAADDLVRFAGIRRHKIVVVPHGVDRAHFSAVERVVDPARFVFVSKPFDYKGLSTLIRAMRTLVHGPLPEARLDVADGGLPAADAAEFEELIGRLDLNGAVTLLGRVEQPDLPRLYARAAALVVPTMIESFGNAYVEAAAAGCPSITGRGHGIDESIGPVAAQVPVHDHAALA